MQVYSVNMLNSRNGTLVVWVQEPITGLTVIVGPSTVGVSQNFLLQMTTGTDYACTWNMGDGNTFTTYSTMPASQPYTYTTAGAFSASITCANNVSTQTYSYTQNAQIPIGNLHFVKTSATTNTPFTVDFALSAGTAVTCDLLTWDGAALTYTFNPVTLQGSSNSLSGVSPGIHTASVRCYNLVSTNIVASANFTVETQIVGATSAASTLATLVNTPISFTVTIANGSGVQVTWSYADSTPDNVYSLAPLQPWPAGSSQTMTHSFTAIGTYNVIVNVTNSVSVFTFQHVITIHPNLGTLTMQTNQPVAFVNSQANFIAWFTAPSTIPSGLTVTFDFGDGTVTPPLSFSVSKQYTHTFTKTGSYLVNATVDSGFSKEVVTMNVNVMEPVANVFAIVEPSVATTNIPVTYSIGMYQGSNVTLYASYGDNGNNIDIVIPRTGE